MKTLIDFEDKNEHAWIDNDYLHKHLIVESGGSIEVKPGLPHSGMKYLDVYRAEFSVWSPLFLRFTRPQKRVALYAGAIVPPGSTVVGTFLAFDNNNNNLAQDGAKLVASGSCATFFEVKAAGNSIVHARLLMFGFQPNGSAFDPDQIVDDIEFEAEPREARPGEHHEIYWGISPGIAAGGGGWRWGPHGPEPWPPPNPVVMTESALTDVFWAVYAGRIADLIEDEKSRKLLSRAAAKSAKIGYAKIMERVKKGHRRGS
ncbi:MAG: hypothetical protein ACRD4U_06135 [Candidatus Acidiferrales bacterium]